MLYKMKYDQLRLRYRILIIEIRTGRRRAMPRIQKAVHNDSYLATRIRHLTLKRSEEFRRIPLLLSFSIEGVDKKPQAP